MTATEWFNYLYGQTQPYRTAGPQLTIWVLLALLVPLVHVGVSVLSVPLVHAALLVLLVLSAFLTSFPMATTDFTCGTRSDYVHDLLAAPTFLKANLYTNISFC